MMSPTAGVPDDASKCTGMADSFGNPSGKERNISTLFMGGPLVKLICVRAISVAKRVARHFRGASVYVAEALCLPCVCTLGGLFLFCFGVGVHGTNGRFFWPFEPLNCSQQSCEVV